MKKRFILILVGMLLLSTLVGCTTSKKDYITIEPSQTAFLVPLVGDTSEQGVFQSQELLQDAKVATKRVVITYTKEKVGFLSWKKYPTATLIIVERKPETREWTESSDTGTSAVNQGIMAESMESISFMARMNISAQIQEEDATQFLYLYSGKPLSEILDTEIRARVESVFVETCSKMTMAEILVGKTEIMDTVRTDVIQFFADRGITITVLGLKGDLTYSDVKIQEAINLAFTAKKEAEAQDITNQMNIDKAEAEKTVAITNAEAEAEAIQLIQNMLNNSPAYIEYLKAMRWNGEMPEVVGSSGGLIIDLTD